MGGTYDEQITEADELQLVELRDWVSCLHEGHLTALRSPLAGSNSRLNDAAVSMSIDKFIMLVPLGGGMRLPSTLQTEVRAPSGETQPFFAEGGRGGELINNLKKLIFFVVNERPNIDYNSRS